MKPRLILMAAAAGLTVTPVTASACEFDGLPGFHRFNPFLQETKGRWPAPPAEARSESGLRDDSGEELAPRNTASNEKPKAENRAERSQDAEERAATDRLKEDPFSD